VRLQTRYTEKSLRNRYRKALNDIKMRKYFRETASLLFRISKHIEVIDFNRNEL
jgi:hypothetical protein